MPAAPRTLLLKLSGEALGNDEAIHDGERLARVCAEIGQGLEAGQRIAVVVGGGNILRGASVAAAAADPTAGDHMGMLATLINGVALRDRFTLLGVGCLVLGPYAVPEVCERFARARAMEALDAGQVVIFAGGTGHPFLTTDTAAALRGAQIAADELLKATNVDGVYECDPRHDPTAQRFAQLTFDECLAKRYAVMDQTAFTLCRDRRLPIRVFDMTPPGSIAAALGDDPPGTLIVP